MTCAHTTFAGMVDRDPGRSNMKHICIGEKSAPLEKADGVWLAWRLLREMAAEGKA
ncbi:MAG: hypothetical protein WA728_37585 [Xanthobacteraceae bacterium]